LADLLSSQVSESVGRGDVEGGLNFEVRLADVYDRRLGNRAKAIETYTSILARRADHRGALESLVRLHQSAGDHAAAATHLETLLASASGEDAQRLAVTLADEYRAISDMERASVALERGLAVDPTNAKVRDLVRALYEENKAWDK